MQILSALSVRSHQRRQFISSTFAYRNDNVLKRTGARTFSPPPNPISAHPPQPKEFDNRHYQVTDNRLQFERHLVLFVARRSSAPVRPPILCCHQYRQHPSSAEIPSSAKHPSSAPRSGAQHSGLHSGARRSGTPVAPAPQQCRDPQ